MWLWLAWRKAARPKCTHRVERPGLPKLRRCCQRVPPPRLLRIAGCTQNQIDMAIGHFEGLLLGGMSVAAAVDDAKQYALRFMRA